MFSWLAYIPLIFSALVSLATTIFLLGLWQNVLFTKAPFVPLPKKALPDVIQVLNLQPGDRLYDLGCGDGRVLIAAWRQQPQARFIGIDKDWLPAICSHWRLWRAGRPSQIEILRKNFFKQDLSNATHIFTYLFPKLMDNLLPKLTAELRPGTRLISCDFYFTNKKPIQIIDLQRPKNALAKKLYVYEF